MSVSVATLGGLGSYLDLFLVLQIARDGHGNTYLFSRHEVLKVTEAGEISVVYQFPDRSLGLAMAVDREGNVYVSQDWPLVVKIDPTGNRTSIVDRSPKSRSPEVALPALHEITALAVDNARNLYMVDWNRIWKVDADGYATVLAGSDGIGFADGKGGLNGPARFFDLQSIAVDDDGTVYAIDDHNLRRIDTSMNVSTVVQGVAEWGRAMAVDVTHAVYLASDTKTVLRVDSSGAVETVAGTGEDGFTDGPAGVATFSSLLSLAIDPDGSIFVLDQDNHAIRKIDPSRNVTTFATSMPPRLNGHVAGPIEFDQPWEMAVDSLGNAYVSDLPHSCIRKLSRPHNVSAFLGDCVPINAPPFVGLAVDSTDNVLVSQAGRVLKVDPQGHAIIVAGNGKKSSTDGTGGTNGTASFANIVALTADHEGNVFVVDGPLHQAPLLRRIDLSGNVSTLPVDLYAAVAGLATDSQGNLYLACEDSRVRKVDTAGRVTIVAGNGRNAGSSCSEDVCLAGGYSDGTGGEDGQASFFGPHGLVADAAGNIFVADTYNNRIRRIAPDGQVTTVAGYAKEGLVDGATGCWAWPGAEFAWPCAIGLGPGNTLFVLDHRTGRIRLLSP